MYYRWVDRFGECGAGKKIERDGKRKLRGEVKEEKEIKREREREGGREIRYKTSEKLR